MKYLLFICMVVVVQVSAQQKKPPHDLKIWNTLDDTNHVELHDDQIYYKLDVVKKQPIKIQCQANGNPKPTYKWKQNGMLLQTDSHFEVDSTTGLLHLASPDTIHDGYYQCFAENRYGIGLSKVIQVIRQRLGGFSTAQLPQSETTSVGSPFKIECREPPVSVPQAAFVWVVGTDHNDIPATNSKRYSIDAQGSLHFIYVTQEDQAGSDSYYCGLTDETSTQYGSPTSLTVSGGSLKQFGPVSRHVSPEITGYILGEVILECIFAGYPVPSITWKNKNGQQIKSNGDKYEIMDYTRKLKIKKLANGDEGMYSCESSSNIDDATGQIFLNVTSKPIWVKAPTDQTAPAGGVAEFTCLAEPASGETPISPPVWMKNGEALRSSDFGEDKKFLLSQDGTTLYVQNLRMESDLMCIQCNTSNEIGYEFKDASLTVVEAIVITNQPPDEIYLARDNSTELQVDAVGGPYHDITYEWLHNGEPLKHNPPHIIIDNNKLKIDSDGLNDTAFTNLGGVYTCVVKNGVQETPVDVMIKPEYVQPTQSPVVSSAELDLWWIALLIALIILLIVIILICCMCRQYPKGDYHVDEKERKAGHNPEKELQDSGFHDLSRADDDFPDKPRMDNISLTGSEKPIESDDDSLRDYDSDMGKFNEDGSFIGIYADRGKGTNQSAV